jgi:hypothetical protein
MTAGGPERIGFLMERGQQALDAGEAAAAAGDFGDAAGLARGLVAEHPGDSHWPGVLGSVLYSLGEALSERGDHAESVSVLTEAEGAYRQVTVPDAALLTADVRLRRALALAELGAGASAVIDAQAAVLAYIRRAAPDRVDAAHLGLARALMLASDVFGAFADPVMALTAAQQGLSWAVEAANAGQADVRDAVLGPAVVRAASAELVLLEVLGRAGEQASAAGLLAWLGAAAVPTLTRRRLDGGGLSAASGGVDGAVRSLQLMTGSDNGLDDLLVRHPVGPLCAPVLRVPPDALVLAAGGAARAAALLLARGVAAGVRLGLEAHFLMAYVLEQSFEGDGAGPPRELDEVLVPWCWLLATVAARLDADGDEALARDVADWGTKVFLLVDPSRDVPEDAVMLGAAVAVLDRLSP